ncbi:hypothetical protein NMD70_04295 [Edwardsiella tarda]
MTPSSVREVTLRGHRVMVESTAGAGIGYSDELYRQAGAEVVADAATLFASAELIVKVKEPQAAECARLRPGQILFTYLHLAPDLAQTQALLASGATCIAYETVTQREGACPCWRRCRRWPGGCRSRRGPRRWRRHRAGAASC